MARRPAGLTMSRHKAPPDGGTWTKWLRPIQNTSVASAISTPGTPNATPGPKLSSNRGITINEAAEPRLIEK